MSIGLVWSSCSSEMLCMSCVIFSVFRFTNPRTAFLVLFFLNLQGAAAYLDELFHWIRYVSGAKMDLSSTTWCLHNSSETLLFYHLNCLDATDFAVTFHFLSIALHCIECVHFSIFLLFSVVWASNEGSNMFETWSKLIYFNLSIKTAMD